MWGRSPSSTWALVYHMGTSDPFGSTSASGDVAKCDAGGARFSLPLWGLTMANPQEHPPRPPKPDSLRYMPQSAGTPSHFLPSDRRIHAAKRVRPLAPTTDSTPGPFSL